MWWWAPTNAHHCAIQPTITLTTFLYCILQCTNNATSSCSKAINQFSIITQKFPGGPVRFKISRISRRVFKFQEISRISRSCRHPDISQPPPLFVAEIMTKMQHPHITQLPISRLWWLAYRLFSNVHLLCCMTWSLKESICTLISRINAKVTAVHNNEHL